MDSSRPLVPAFIKKIDRKLLLNSPSVWSTRTHLVLFFGILFAVLLTLFCMFVFRDARQESSMIIITFFVALISFLGFIFWLIYLLRFNVFKRYGNWVNGDGIRTFALFFVNVLLMVAIPFIPTAIETYMANKQFKSTEMVKDVNDLNLQLNKLNYNKLPLIFKKTKIVGVVGKYELNERDNSNDTSLIWRSGYKNSGEAEDAVAASSEEVTESDINIDYVNIKELTKEKLKADSINIINDSTFISYEYPDYVYARGYNFNAIDDKSILGSKEIYNKAIKNYAKTNKDSLTKNINTIVAKYVLSDKYNYNNYNDVEKENYSEYIRRSYKINGLNDSVGNILRKKYLLDKDWNIFLRIMYYITLIVSLLVFIFRHTTIRTFFLTALVAVVLVITTALFISFLNISTSVALVIMILYFVLFAILGLSSKMASTRTLARGIGLNLFLFTIPILPLLITGLYYEIAYAHNYNYDGSRTYFDKEIYYFYAEVIGFVLLVILIEPLFKKLYRAWYAAAEE